MFTGLIERVGKIMRVQTLAMGKKFMVDPGKDYELSLGDSVAIDGACFTVAGMEGPGFWVEVSGESLSRTTFAKKQSGDQVNLERSLKLSDRLGGHLVLGHVDGIGRIKRIEKRGGFVEMAIEAGKQLSDYMVEKGSVAVDGVSLTVNGLKGAGFSVMLIPETLKRTTLGDKKIGGELNLESDIIGKYVARLLKKGRAGESLSLEKLTEEGY